MTEILGMDTPVPLLFGTFARGAHERGWAQLMRLTDGLTTVGLDCGLPWLELEKKLYQFGSAPSLDYLALTHFHGDHFHHATVRDLVIQGHTKLCLPASYSRETRAKMLRKALLRRGRKFTPRIFTDEKELCFTAKKLRLRTLAARHNGQSGISNIILLTHGDMQLLYVTDVAQIPQQIFRFIPDVCVMEMNHPPSIKVTSREVRLSRKVPLNAGTANHLSNLDVFTYLRNRHYLNLHVQTADRLKLFVAMHLGPANTKLEVLHALSNAFIRLSRRPLIAVRGNEKVYVGWIEGRGFDCSPALHLWAFSDPLFGVYRDEVRVWEKGPIQGPKAVENFTLAFRFEPDSVPIIRRSPDAAYWLFLQQDNSVRLSPMHVSGLESELYEELLLIKRKGRRDQAFSSLVS